MARNKISKLGQDILEVLKEIGELTYKISISYADRSVFSRPSYYRAVRSLQNEKLIKKNYQKPGAYVLTDKGRQLLHKPRQKIKRSDGLSTIIIFDIPETKSRERTIFRRYLLRNGYTLLQKSVLISPFKITNEILDLVYILKIRQYITSLDAKVTYMHS